MDSDQNAMQIPLTEVLAELQEMGVLSSRDIQMASARVTARILRGEVEDLTRELEIARARLEK